MTRFLYGMLILAMFFLSGCAGLKLNEPTPSCSALPWAHEPPPGFDTDQFAGLVKEVEPKQRDEAVNALRDHLFVEVTPEKAAQLTGMSADTWSPGLTFLLRGMRYRKSDDSRYSVVYDETGAVAVIYIRVGDTRDKPYESPVVAVLPQRPAALYVTCKILH